MPDSTKKILRISEILLIFIILPILYILDVIPGPKSIPLLLVFGLCLWLILRDKSFDRKMFRLNGFKAWNKLLIRFLIIAALFTVYVLIFEPEKLLILPRSRLLLWVIIMIFYPIWSAYPQELIYRAFYFHRYGFLFKKKKVKILINALLFSFMHIIFNNWIAIVATFLAGLMFASTYLKSKSLMVVAIEHLLYGNFIYTIGLGNYFYAPDF
jgi:membrane protease YdiL (CAAX protease family)